MLRNVDHCVVQHPAIDTCEVHRLRLWVVERRLQFLGKKLGSRLIGGVFDGRVLDDTYPVLPEPGRGTVHFGRCNAGHRAAGFGHELLPKVLAQCVVAAKCLI
jgi:hypothetical protein